MKDSWKKSGRLLPLYRNLPNSEHPRDTYLVDLEILLTFVNQEFIHLILWAPSSRNLFRYRQSRLALVRFDMFHCKE